MSHKTSAHHHSHPHAPHGAKAAPADAATPATAGTGATAEAAPGPAAGVGAAGAATDTQPVPLTPAEVEELKARAAKADEHWHRLLRTSADFDNFKKRAARERQEAVQFANESLMQSLLPVLDTFEMALAAAAGAGEGPAKALFDGVGMVRKQLRDVLAEAGLGEVDATGQVFDPQVHEAISQLESAEVPEGHVLHQLRKGYKLRGRLLRPASVVVAKAPAADASPATAATPAPAPA